MRIDRDHSLVHHLQIISVMALVSKVSLFASGLGPALRVFSKCSTLTRSLPVYSKNILSRSIATSSRLYDVKKFTSDHEWVLKTDDDHATMGITDYAQDKLGNIVYIELPGVGETYAKEDVFGTVESVKAASDVMAALSGEITEVNTLLEETPELVNSDPYGEGWLVKMKLSEPSEVDGLMSEEEYSKYLEECV